MLANLFVLSKKMQNLKIIKVAADFTSSTIQYNLADCENVYVLKLTAVNSLTGKRIGHL
jgi:hypothetical protein